jgi:hypothetical protein
MDKLKEVNSSLNNTDLKIYYKDCRKKGYSKGTCAIATATSVVTETIVSAGAETMATVGTDLATIAPNPITKIAGALAVPVGTMVYVKSGDIGQVSGDLVMKIADFISDNLLIPIDRNGQLVVSCDDMQITFTKQETRFISDVVVAKNYTMSIYNELSNSIQNIDEYIKSAIVKINENKEMKAEYDEGLKVIRIELNRSKSKLSTVLDTYHANYFQTNQPNNYTSNHRIVSEPAPVQIQWGGGEIKGGGTASAWVILIPIVKITFSTAGFCLIL